MTAEAEKALAEIIGAHFNDDKPCEPDLPDYMLARAILAAGYSRDGRGEALEEAAKIADAHKGSYAKRPAYKQIMRSASEEDKLEIRAEERGEDIAAEMIARAIRGLS